MTIAKIEFQFIIFRKMKMKEKDGTVNVNLKMIDETVIREKQLP